MVRMSITLALVLTGSLVYQPLMAATVFRVAYPFTENSPRTIGNGTAVPEKTPGISVELLRMAGKKLGMAVAFIRVPWKRCLYLVEQGMADAAFHASYKPVRTAYGVYPMKDGGLDPERAIYTGRYAVYVPKDTKVEWDGRTFKNADLPIGTLLGAAGASDLRKLNYDVEEEHSVRANFDKLQAGRISAVVEIETIGNSYLARHPGRYPGIKKLPAPFREKVYYLLISRHFYQQHPELSEAVFDALRDIKKTAAYRSMVNKYK